MTSFSPVRFGKYLLLDPIAVGGMAELFRAKMTGDEGFEKLIVVKKILPHLVNERELVESFIYEARLAAHLQHENIIRTYDFGRMQDDYFIAMEFLFGKNLRMIIEKARSRGLTLGLENILHVMALVCTGLDYAHGLKDLRGDHLHIVHRDISPPNIFVTYDGHVKVVDFGVAKAASKNTTTQHGVIKGKVAYMSPEQASGKEIDHRSDIFAVGCILYELVTGKRMYEGDTMQVLVKAQGAQFEPPGKLVKGMSRSLTTVFARALAKDPGERYQTCGEMLAGIEDVMVELSIRPSQRGLASYMKALFDDVIDKEEELMREVAQAEVYEVQLASAHLPPGSGAHEPTEFIQAVPDQQACPACGKPVEGGADFCPWCDADMNIPASAQARPGQDAAPCPACGKRVSAHYKVCNFCGARMPAPGMAPAPAFGGLPALGPDNGPGRTLPVMIYYNAGKVPLEKTMDYLEMAAANTLSVPLEGFRAALKGTLMAKDIEERLPFAMEPGRPYPLNIPGFLPRCAGKDSLRLEVEGRTQGGEAFFLLGAVPVEVAPKDEAAPNVNVNISAKGPLIVDMEDAIPGLAGKRRQDSDPAAPRWVPVELHPDMEKQQDAARKFPPACITASACPLDEAVLAALHAISPENAPQARFTCPDGTVHHLVPGASLLLGRKRDINHVPSFLFPEAAHEAENVKVSRSHCRVFIRKNRVYVRDSSSNGTFFGKERLPSKEDIMLPSGQQVVVGGVLELGADIFTDGRMILAVRLKRQNNKTNERYILAHGPVPVGTEKNIPIQVAGAPKFLGAIYYNPMEDQWVFRTIEGFASPGREMKLVPGKSLAFGKVKCRFDISPPGGP